MISLEKPDDYANPGSKPGDYAGDDCAAQDCTSVT